MPTAQIPGPPMPRQEKISPSESTESMQTSAAPWTSDQRRAAVALVAVLATAAADLREGPEDAPQPLIPHIA